MSFVNNFDPNIMDVATSYFAVCAKYAVFFGIFGFLMKMLTRAFTGKTRVF